MNIARQPLWLVIIQLLLLLALFWVRFAAYPLPGEESLPAFPGVEPGAASVWGAGSGLMPGDWVNHWASKFPPAAAVIGLLLVVAIAVSIMRGIGHNLIFSVRTHLPMLFYAATACGIVMGAADTAGMAGALLVAAACRDIVSLSISKNMELGLSFRYGFLLGLAALLAPATLFCLLLIPLTTLFMMRNGRETGIALAGYFLPLLAWGYVVWGSGGDFAQPFTSIWEGSFGQGIGLPDRLAALGMPKMIVLGILILISISAAMGFAASRGSIRTRTLRVSGLMFAFLFLSVISLLLMSPSASLFAVAAIPAAFVCPIFFLRFRGIYADLLYIIFIGGLIAANLLPFTDLSI